MRFILLLFFVGVNSISNSQIAKSYFYNGGSNFRSGTYIEKHPTQNAYFVACENTSSTYAGTVITKIDNTGNTLWYSSVPHSGPNVIFNGIGDLKVTTTNIFLSVFHNPTFTTATLRIYKFDLDGVLLDSAILGAPGGLEEVKSGMSFGADGNIFTALKDNSNNIHFCKINPATMDILTQQIVAFQPFTNLDARRGIFTNVVGINSVLCFNGDDTVKFVVIDPTDIVIDEPYFLSPDGQATDVEYYNNEFHVLINKYFTISLAADNPLRIITIDNAGLITSNIIFPVQNAVVFENLAIDVNGDIFIATRAQGSAVDGSMLKIAGSSLQYEHYLPRTKLTEIDISGNNLICAGAQSDATRNCLNEVNYGLAFITHRKSVTPTFEVASAHMIIDNNNITAAIAYSDHNFQNQSGIPSGFSVSGAGNPIGIISLLIMGEDISSNIKSSSYNYQSIYAAGPVTNQIDYNQIERDRWERVWKINKDLIDAHIQAFLIGDATYQTPEVILNWPGNGNPTKGQSQKLARFQDLNNNDIYEPLLGEYPLIKGDYCILSIYNDVNSDTSNLCIPSSQRMNVEVFEYAYGFDCSQDSSIQNTLFLYYEIINKSGITIYNTHVGQFTDMDIEFSIDDYIGSDPLRGIFYGKNGSAGPFPEQAFMILASEQDDDGFDNAQGILPGESPNGVGYGNGISDDERMGMTQFLYHNIGGGANGDPNTIPDYYNYLQSVWQNGQHQLYGGNGVSTGTTLIESTFSFPGDSDTIFYSTNGIDPGFAWSEESAGNSMGDRRGIASSGPITFFDNDTIRFDIAYVTGMENIGAGYSSHDAMIANVDSARNYFAADLTPCGQDFDFYAPFTGTYTTLAIAEKEMPKPILFPNPTNGNFTIQGLTNQTTIRIFSVSGQLISETMTNQTSINFDYSDLPKGIYFVQINDENYSGTLCVVKQ